jgi:hypothetical protein
MFMFKTHILITMTKIWSSSEIMSYNVVKRIDIIYHPGP